MRNKTLKTTLVLFGILTVPVNAAHGGERLQDIIGRCKELQQQCRESHDKTRAAQIRIEALLFGNPQEYYAKRVGELRDRIERLIGGRVVSAQPPVGNPQDIIRRCEELQQQCRESHDKTRAAHMRIEALLFGNPQEYYDKRVGKLRKKIEATQILFQLHQKGQNPNLVAYLRNHCNALKMFQNVASRSLPNSKLLAEFEAHLDLLNMWLLCPDLGTTILRSELEVLPGGYDAAKKMFALRFLGSRDRDLNELNLTNAEAAEKKRQRKEAAAVLRQQAEKEAREAVLRAQAAMEARERREAEVAEQRRRQEAAAKRQQAIKEAPAQLAKQLQQALDQKMPGGHQHTADLAARLVGAQITLEELEIPDEIREVTKALITQKLTAFSAADETPEAAPESLQIPLEPDDVDKLYRKHYVTLTGLLTAQKLGREHVNTIHNRWLQVRNIMVTRFNIRLRQTLSAIKSKSDALKSKNDARRSIEEDASKTKESAALNKEFTVLNGELSELTAMRTRQEEERTVLKQNDALVNSVWTMNGGDSMSRSTSFVRIES